MEALHKKVSYKEARIMFNALKKLIDVVIFEPFERYLNEAMEISMKEGVTVYNALYIAQAKALDCLLTSDEKQWKIANKIGIQSEFIE